MAQVVNPGLAARSSPEPRPSRSTGWHSAERVLSQGSREAIDTVGDDGEISESTFPDAGGACDCEACQAYREERRANALADLAPAEEEVLADDAAVQPTAEEIALLRAQLKGRAWPAAGSDSGGIT